jgi:hypothetical protein
MVRRLQAVGAQASTRKGVHKNSSSDEARQCQQTQVDFAVDCEAASRKERQRLATSLGVERGKGNADERGAALGASHYICVMKNVRKGRGMINRDVSHGQNGHRQKEIKRGSRNTSVSLSVLAGVEAL